jgi:hypothetical protein
MYKTSRSIAVATAILIAGVSGSAFASSANSVNGSIRAADNNISAAFNDTNMNYQENISTLPADSETGFMPGFTLGTSFLGSVYGINNLYADVHYTRNSGAIAYKGSLSNGAVYNGTDNATTNRVSARFGMAFPVAHNVAVIPYVAGGYQQWSRNIAGQFGYSENYSTGLVGVGGLAQYTPMRNVVLTANANIEALVGGGMTPSGVPGVPSGYYGSTSFKTSGEQNLGVSANYEFAPSWSVFAGLKYTHFTYTGGPLNYGAKEPSSATNLFGVDTGIAYNF